MRHDLHRLAEEVIALTLTAQKLVVNLPSGDVRQRRQVFVQKALVMPQVEVGLGAVVRHEYLAVFVRRHRAGINVQVGIKLDDRYVDAPVLEHPAD